MSEYVLKGYPEECVGDSTTGAYNKLATDRTKSLSREFVGDLSEVFITPAVGNRLIIKGVTLHGNGNAGSVKLISGVRIILPLYFSNSSRVGTSGALNIELAVNETASILATGRGANTTFVGVSYIEVVGA